MWILALFSTQTKRSCETAAPLKKKRGKKRKTREGENAAWFVREGRKCREDHEGRTPIFLPHPLLPPFLPSLLTRPINFRVYNAHVPCKCIVPRKGFLLRTEMTTDLLLAGIVYGIFVTG